MHSHLDRECVTTTGTPKRRYDTRADARAVIRSGQRFDGCSPYRCACCGYFHIGHYPSRPATRAELRRRHRAA